MFDSLVGEAQRWVAEYGYPAIFIGMFLENFGVPTPGESLMIAGALFASAGRLDIRILLLSCWVAAVLGYDVGYVIGRRGGRPLILRYGPRIYVTRKRIEQVEGFFGRHGGAVVVFARFFPVLRQLTGVVAGTMGMNWWHFLAYNALGAALWVGFWGGLAYWFGRRFGAILHWISSAEPVIIAVAIAGGAIVLGTLWYLRRKQQNRRR